MRTFWSRLVHLGTVALLALALAVSSVATADAAPSASPSTGGVSHMRLIGHQPHQGANSVGNTPSTTKGSVSPQLQLDCFIYDISNKYNQTFKMRSYVSCTGVADNIYQQGDLDQCQYWDHNLDACVGGWLDLGPKYSCNIDVTQGEECPQNGPANVNIQAGWVVANELYVSTTALGTTDTGWYLGSAFFF